MPRFAHLIFDLDGTLVDTKADLAAATNHMLRELGLPLLSVAQVESFIGLGARVLIERALGQERANLVAAGFTLFMDYYDTHLLDRTKPYPGMETLLTVARDQGKCLSVLTNKPERPTRAILSGLGLLDHFQAIIGGDTLPKRKPDPQGVFVLQQAVGHARTETLLVGDSEIDMRTGQAAGIATCGVTWGFGHAGFETCPPTFLVETVPALQRIVMGPSLSP
jgi:phosphoglycolate phosphatase